MGQFGESIKKRPLNLLLIVLVAVLYVLNNLVLKKSFHGAVRFFLVCYMNDLICPLLFLSYINLLLISINRELEQWPQILTVSLCAGAIWEFLAPVFKPSSVTDPWDLACYTAGGMTYWAALNIWKKWKENR